MGWEWDGCITKIICQYNILLDFQFLISLILDILSGCSGASSYPCYLIVTLHGTFPTFMFRPKAGKMSVMKKSCHSPAVFM